MSRRVVTPDNGRRLNDPPDESRCKYCLSVLTDGDIVYDRHDCKPALTLIQGGKA